MEMVATTLISIMDAKLSLQREQLPGGPSAESHFLPFLILNVCIEVTICGIARNFGPS